MKILVTGGRDYNDLQTLYIALDKIKDKYGVTELVNGGCVGADRLSSRWAAQRGVIFHEVLADWDKHGKSAGPKRNAKMLRDHHDIEIVVAFNGGIGTSDMLGKARLANKKVIKNIVLVDARALYDVEDPMPDDAEWGNTNE
jgi:hypothetical protein